METASDERTFRRLKSLILREVQRQVVAPRSLLRLRIYMYYNLNLPADKGGIELLWVMLFYAIERMVQEGDLREAPPSQRHGPWLYLSAQEHEALRALDRRAKLYGEWRDEKTSKAGSHGEVLVREALKKAGFTVADKPVKMQHRKDELEIDVATFGPLQLAVEVKNKLSDVYHSPAVTRRDPGEDLRQIVRHFKLSRAAGMVPVLVASLIDPSFFSFQRDHGGLHYRMLFQYLPSEDASFCQRIRREFRFGHLRATDEPPQWMQRWFNRLEEYHRKAYGGSI